MKKIAIFSVPRSGSTWLGQILNSSPNVLYKFQPNFSYSFDQTLTEDASEIRIEEFFRSLETTNDPFVNGEVSISSKENLKFKKSQLEVLVFKETHYLYLTKTLLQNSEVKIIGLIRSPFATLNSWLHTPKEFHSDWDVSAEWENAQSKNEDSKSNYFGYVQWKAVAIMFLKLQEQFPERFHLVNYDDLLLRKQTTVHNIFKFCGLQVSPQTQQFLEYSSQREDVDAYSVFRKKSDDNQWQDSLPQFIVDAIKKDDEFIYLNQIFKWI